MSHLGCFKCIYSYISVDYVQTVFKTTALQKWKKYHVISFLVCGTVTDFQAAMSYLICIFAAPSFEIPAVTIYISYTWLVGTYLAYKRCIKTDEAFGNIYGTSLVRPQNDASGHRIGNVVSFGVWMHHTQTQTHWRVDKWLPKSVCMCWFVDVYVCLCVCSPYW